MWREIIFSMEWPITSRSPGVEAKALTELARCGFKSKMFPCQMDNPEQITLPDAPKFLLL